jgi:GMP synthase (glutamine-hydrolysing)
MVECRGGVLVLDFGGQYAHLIRRRVRELGVRCELVEFGTTPQEIMASGAKGIILSGGPASVYQPNSPRPAARLESLRRPVLGICYGYQLIAKEFGGEVERSSSQEFGAGWIHLKGRSQLLEGVPRRTRVWLSHSDSVKRLPSFFKVVAVSSEGDAAVVENKALKIFGLKFHPEVSQSSHGMKILSNFLFNVCKCDREVEFGDLEKRIVDELRGTMTSGLALCAVSGGVDSTTAAVLAKRAIGDRLVCLFVDHGLMRKGEVELVLKTLTEKLGLNVKFIDASQTFLDRLKGVRDPEEKRRVVGEQFARVFEDFARRQTGFKWLVQGTLYPDVIESAASKVASRIKSHHNVGGLPADLELRVVEPLRDLYKDEVRSLALKLGIPKKIVSRNPFPGPGLAVRVIGEVTAEKLRICRESSHIFEQELRRAGILEKLWQAFAIVGDDMFVGVAGDSRRVGYSVILKAVHSEDGMTARWARLSLTLLERVSKRITNSIPEVVSVAYAVSDKPPATIEPQ